MSRELLQQALDALETIRRIEDLEYGSLSKSGKAVSAIRSELAKPEPYDQQALELCGVCGWKAIIPGEPCLVCERNARMLKPVQLGARPPCSRHPDAPHGLDRTASHNADRYVCVCESWVPGEAS
jgi:hypothetical protein